MIVAAGAESGHIAHLMGIGASRFGQLRTELPIEPRKRHTYLVHAPKGPGLNCPAILESSGFNLRRKGYGGHYLVTRAPSEEEEEYPDNLTPNMDYFEEKIREPLSHRIPDLKDMTVNMLLSNSFLSFLIVYLLVKGQGHVGQSRGVQLL